MPKENRPDMLGKEPWYDGKRDLVSEEKGLTSRAKASSCSCSETLINRFTATSVCHAPLYTC